jgi:hypothetical protein
MHYHEVMLFHDKAIAKPHCKKPPACVVTSSHAPIVQEPARLWAAVILLMGLGVLATGWFPLLSITALPSENYNEGWNAYRQWMTVAGEPLYGSHTALWTTNYPFLSFHIIGLLGAAKGNMVLAGRIVCFASLIVTSVLVGGIIRRATGSLPGALYAGLCLFAWLAAFNGAGRAVDDPELLSVAFASFGLFAYLRASRGIFWPTLSAIAFALSLFTKHDLIAFPLSVGTHLLITRNWRMLAIFLGAGIIASGLLLALSFHLDGPYFFTELLQPRAYSFRNLTEETLHYLLHFLVPMLIGVVCLYRDRTTPHRSFLFTLLIFTDLASIYFSGGDGVGANIFYPPLIANLLSCVIAICWLERRALDAPRARRSFKTALILTTLAGALMVPFQLHNDIEAQLRLPAATQAAQQAIALLKSTNGPAICEDLLLCYEAGKPMDYDPYYVNDQIRIGRVQARGILALLTTHHYAAIQMNGMVDTASLAHRKDSRFTTAFLRTFLAQYQPVLVNRTYSVFVPRG